MNYDLATDLHEAMFQADADESVRVIVLTGAGKSFCVGADVGAIKKSTPAATGGGAAGVRGPCLAAAERETACFLTAAV